MINRHCNITGLRLVSREEIEEIGATPEDLDYPEEQEMLFPKDNDLLIELRTTLKIKDSVQKLEERVFHKFPKKKVFTKFIMQGPY